MIYHLNLEILQINNIHHLSMILDIHKINNYLNEKRNKIVIFKFFNKVYLLKVIALILILYSLIYYSLSFGRAFNISNSLSNLTKFSSFP